MTFKRNEYGIYISNIDERFFVRKDRFGSYEVFYGYEYVGSSQNLKGIKERFKDTDLTALQNFLGQFFMDRVHRSGNLGRFGYDFTRFDI